MPLADISNALVFKDVTLFERHEFSFVVNEHRMFFYLVLKIHETFFSPLSYIEI